LKVGRFYLCVVFFVCSDVLGVLWGCFWELCECCGVEGVKEMLVCRFLGWQNFVSCRDSKFSMKSCYSVVEELIWITHLREK